MGDALRNETDIVLSTGKAVMRADVDAIRGIEEEVGRGIFRLYRDFNAFDFSFGDVVSVIYHGLREAGGKLTPDEVAKEVMSMGIDTASAAALNFLTGSMKGQSLGKSKPPAKK